jgi:hypothetical protein
MTKMIKKEWVMAVILLLLIPVALMLGGELFSLINPEIAVHTSNYVFYWHLLSGLKIGIFWGMLAVVFVLWVLVCLQVIRAKKRSAAWLLLAVLGPFGLAVLAMLSDAPANGATTNDATLLTDPYSRFVRKMNWFVRASYEVGTFFIFWELAYRIMLLKSNLMMRVEAARTGISLAQVIDLHNASGGMWAFSEGLEVMFLVVLLYLLRPVVFNIVSRLIATTASPKAT